MHVERTSKAGTLVNLVKLGFQPATVIDVGVQQGTPELYSAFPKSVHVLIEPVAEQEPHLKAICDSLEFATYIIAAAGATTGEAFLRVSSNFKYSSFHGDEAISACADHFVRPIQTIAIDDLAAQSKMAGPAVLKVDVDGKELEVLKGAEKFLEKVEVLIVEATLFGQIQEILSHMLARNFVLYDIVDHLYRPLDGALWQVDLVFVPEKSPLRSRTAYADEEELRSLLTED